MEVFTNSDSPLVCIQKFHENEKKNVLKVVLKKKHLETRKVEQ